MVTPALPYANGPIHLGHLLEHIQVNVFVRALRMDQQDVLYVCGADSHGTPIEMNALRAGVSPSVFAADWQSKQEQSLKHFGIEFDGGYGSTHTPANEEHAYRIFNALKAKGLIKTADIEQLFDPELKRFLPDRMVRGICPKCETKDQYGDSCEACGRTYRPTELIAPKSALSGVTPVIKKSTHYFVVLNKFKEALMEWTKEPGTINEDIRPYLDHWFNEGLRDWDISRDGPYFGFLLPDETDKYFYVWLDAPIGYISLCEKAAKERGRSFSDYWQNQDAQIIHFIGKDIIYFHTLFWPAMLMAAQYTLPKKIVVHGMLTVDGEKMSKSRGTFILADVLRKHVSTEALRYYFACKLSDRIEDIDLNLSDFIQRVNTDLVNKVVNLISRSLPLIHRDFQGRASSLDPQAIWLTDKAVATRDEVKDGYLTNKTNHALSEIVRLAEEANRYVQENAPWKLIKDDQEKAHQVLTTALHIGKVCFALLKPVLPDAVAKLETILNEGKPYTFSNVTEPFDLSKGFKPYEHLFTRIDESNIQAMIDESKDQRAKALEKDQPKTAHIDIKQFMDVDLRAAKVLSATAVEGSDKLISCELDVGDLGRRSVLSGLRPHVMPEDLSGKMVVLVANLAPRKMRFGMSEGMILACGEDRPIPLIIDGAKPGDRVR